MKKKVVKKAPAKKAVKKIVKKAIKKAPAKKNVAVKKAAKKPTGKIVKGGKETAKNKTTKKVVWKKEAPKKPAAPAVTKPVTPEMGWKPSFLTDLTIPASKPIPAVGIVRPETSAFAVDTAPEIIPPAPAPVPAIASQTLTPFNQAVTSIARPDPFAGCVPVRPA